MRGQPARFVRYIKTLLASVDTMMFMMRWLDPYEYRRAIL